MESAQEHTYKFKMESNDGRLTVKGEIAGETIIPNYDDMKLNAVIALLNSVDKQNFTASGKLELFDSLITEIEETITEMKKHQTFQGKTMKAN